MSHLAPGMRVLIRDEEWMVESMGPQEKGESEVNVIGVSPLVKGRKAIFLNSLESIRVLKPEETTFISDASPKYNRALLYLESLLRKTPPTDRRIHIADQAAMTPQIFQRLPCEKALNNVRPRILIADAVGLGKTLEVGMLLSELIKRGRGDRILVVAMKSILTQFQQELWQRFTIPLVRLDSKGLERVSRKIPANKNPFSYYNRVIISIDTLKRDGIYNAGLQQSTWDVVVIDECHNVTSRGSDRGQLAQLLAKTCNAMILTSATPHNGRRRDFANLINLLEPTAIVDPENYTANDIEKYVVRRFKKDVVHEAGESFPSRKLSTEKVPASPAEIAFLKQRYELENLQQIRTTPQDKPKTDHLFATTLFKAFLSSPKACETTLNHRIQRLEEISQLPNMQDAYANDLNILRRSKKLLQAVTTYSKIQALHSILAQLNWTGKKSDVRVLIFSERVDTLTYLEKILVSNFKLDKKTYRIFHGGLPDHEQEAIVEEFGKEDAPVRLLLASDVASEGVNLHHFCHNLIHFDIPWSLITLEQRSGRIDRFGQRHTPHIRYLFMTADDETIKSDLYIYDLLIKKEDEVHKSLGDAASVLKLYSAEEEEKTITSLLAKKGDANALFGFSNETQSNTPKKKEETLDDLLAQLDQTPKPEALDLGEDEGNTTISFFQSHAHFMTQWLSQFGGETDLQSDDIHWEGEQQLSIPFSQEIRSLYQFFPEESWPTDEFLHLSFHPKPVMDSIEAARKRQGQWPKVQYLWDLHPVMDWARDKALLAFGRGEAPVIYHRGLVDQEPIFLLQGMIYNKNGQPVLARWLGIQRQGGSYRHIKLEDLIEDLQLRQGLVNYTQDPWQAEPGEVAGILEYFKNLMRQLRKQRAENLQARVKPYLQEILQWKKEKEDRVNAKYRGEVLPGVEIQKKSARYQRELDEAEAHFERIKEWLMNTQSTEDNPFIRITAVFKG